jgi:uncharacterized repeat protein (TIGR01451 family)
MDVSKTVNVPEAHPGDTITYTISYSAYGVPATNVTIYDFLPAGVQLLSTDPPYETYLNGVITFHDDYVDSSVETITISVLVFGGYEQLYNHAVVSVECVTPTHVSLLTEVIQPVEPPSFTPLLTKTGYPMVYAGGELVYTLRCENTSYTTIEDIEVVDVLPTGSLLISSSPAADAVTAPTMHWAVGDLEPGEVWETVITVTAPSYAGFITNTALVDAYGSVMTQTLFSTRVVTEAGVLQVDKEANLTYVPVGDDIVYTISYSNEGERTATNVVLTDTLPNDIIVKNANPAPTSITSERGIWEIGSLDPGESGQITLTVTVAGEPDRELYNVVHITGDDLTFPDQAETSTLVWYSLIFPYMLRVY